MEAFENSPAFKKMNKEERESNSKVRAANEALEVAIENDCDNESRQELEEELKNMEEDYENKTDNSNWFLNNQLVGGAKAIQLLIESAENEEKRRMTKQAFIFR